MAFYSPSANYRATCSIQKGEFSKKLLQVLKKEYCAANTESNLAIWNVKIHVSLQVQFLRRNSFYERNQKLIEKNV